LKNLKLSHHGRPDLRVGQDRLGQDNQAKHLVADGALPALRHFEELSRRFTKCDKLKLLRHFAKCDKLKLLRRFQKCDQNLRRFAKRLYSSNHRIRQLFRQQQRQQRDSRFEISFAIWIKEIISVFLNDLFLKAPNNGCFGLTP
jgi:hypothetical protein